MNPDRTAGCGRAIVLALLTHVGGCAESVSASPGPVLVVCGGVACAEGQACCLTSGQCFDRADPSRCPTPSRDRTPGACASNVDCESSQYCGGSLCLGGGVCTRRDAITCFHDGHSGVCGCDGRTYPTECDAYRAGVRVAAYSECGRASTTDRDPDSGVQPVIGCAVDATCPGGMRCCSYTGLCVDPACTACCAPPPDGGRIGCADNSTCFRHEYCAGAGCGAMGGCTTRPGLSSCGGVVDLVCGCDGRTYSNPCWAAVAGVRVASSGACRDD